MALPVGEDTTSAVTVEPPTGGNLKTLEERSLGLHSMLGRTPIFVMSPSQGVKDRASILEVHSGEHGYESFSSEKMRSVWTQERGTSHTVIPGVIMITVDLSSDATIISVSRLKLHGPNAHGTKMLKGCWTNRYGPRQVEDGLAYASHPCTHWGRH